MTLTKPLNITVLLNAAAGPNGNSADQAQHLRESLQAAGLDASVHHVPAQKLTEAARHAASSGVDAVVAGGGDGTLNAVASALVHTPTPLGVLPLGTLNHFAQDLGIPANLTAAIRILAAGRVRTIDVGQVNDRIFLNNSSIGLYPRLVQDRESQRSRFDRNKWFAMALAAFNALRRLPLVRLRLTLNNQTLHRLTPFLFIGNNRYDTNLLSIGTRPSLTAGHLSLYLAHHTGRFGLLILALHTLLNRLDQAQDFETLDLTELIVSTRRPRLPVALDGEVHPLPPPLHYRILPQSLRVIAP